MTQQEPDAPAASAGDNTRRVFLQIQKHGESPRPTKKRATKKRASPRTPTADEVRRGWNNLWADMGWYEAPLASLASCDVAWLDNIPGLKPGDKVRYQYASSLVVADVEPTKQIEASINLEASDGLPAGLFPEPEEPALDPFEDIDWDDNEEDPDDDY